VTQPEQGRQECQIGFRFASGNWLNQLFFVYPPRPEVKAAAFVFGRWMRVHLSPITRSLSANYDLMDADKLTAFSHLKSLLKAVVKNLTGSLFQSADLSVTTVFQLS
jgi:hypothetical protein